MPSDSLNAYLTALPLFIYIGFNALILNSSEGLKNRLKYNSSSPAWYSHTDLFSYTFFASNKFICVRESLQACSFPISQCSWLCPVIDVCSATPLPVTVYEGLSGSRRL